MKEIEELTQAIAALESQRALLGGRVVDAALASLREKLAGLEVVQSVGRHRSLVTVLFLDVVNSTALSQGREPEEVLEIMGGALKRLSMPITVHGGQVTQFMGDGLVAVFGLGKVRENDARQAVRAGLAVLAETVACAEDLDQRFQMPGFAVRIGINTGKVVAGRFTEGESPVMGLTVSLAARVEQAALPATLFISHYTYQHIRGAFEVEQLPPVEAKGFPQPVPVYRVLAARPRTFHTVTRGVEGVHTGMVGRDEELSQLKSNLIHAMQHRETRLVTVLGEAGVGKSRLLYEFDRWVAQSPYHVISFKARSSPQMTALPFGLLRELISYRMGLQTTDPVESTRHRLVEEMSLYLEAEAEMKAHFVGTLLGFDFSDSPYLKGMESDPGQLNERGQQYLIQYLAAISGMQGAMLNTITILMLDDVHWADEPSMSFIARLVRQCPQLPLLVVCLARPGLGGCFPAFGLDAAIHDPSIPAGTDLPGHLYLELGPLSPQASQELLDAILHKVEAFPHNLRQRILTRADGNPFFLEEFVQSLVDANIIRQNEQGGPWILDARWGENLELPATLDALLEARLDSLDAPQKILIQQAAVIGQVFWRSALQALQGDRLVQDADMEILSGRGLIDAHETSTFADSEEYAFRHGLLRDVAYQALFKSDRQNYHNLAAAWLIQATTDTGRVGEFAPIIAGHYESAAERILSADWYAQSARYARIQGVPAQACSFFDRSLAQLPPDLTSSSSEHEINLYWQALVGRDEVLGLLGDTEKRISSDVALVAFAEKVGNDHLLAEAYFHRGYYLGLRGQYALEREVYVRGLEAARRVHEPRWEAEILGLKILCELRLGDLESARQTSAEAIACAERVADDLVLARCLSNVSTFYTETGDMARGVELLEQQLAVIRRIGNLEDEAVGLSNLGYAYTQLGLPEVGISVLQRCLEISHTINHRKICAYAGLNLALTQLRVGDPSSALQQLEGAQAELNAMNDAFGFAVGQTYTALAKEQAGQISEALADYTQAAAMLSEIGTPGNEHDAEAGMARCLLSLHRLDEAGQHGLLLWDYLMQKSAAGMEFPLLAYETCADVFSANGQSSLGRRAVGAGYGELLIRAGKISLPRWRKSFLEQVPEHYRIQKRWNEYMNQVGNREESM